MQTLFALVLVFSSGTGNQVAPATKLNVYPSQAVCEAQLPISVAYQNGVHANDGFYVNGWCLEVIAK